MKNTETKRTEAELKEAFISLACRLSPENLSCDGECSQAEQNRRWRQIQKEWRALEQEMGRDVFEDEVDGWMMAKWSRA